MPFFNEDGTPLPEEEAFDIETEIQQRNGTRELADGMYRIADGRRVLRRGYNASPPLRRTREEAFDDAQEERAEYRRRSRLRAGLPPLAFYGGESVSRPNSPTSVTEVHGRGEYWTGDPAEGLEELNQQRYMDELEDAMYFLDRAEERDPFLYYKKERWPGEHPPTLKGVTLAQRAAYLISPWWKRQSQLFETSELLKKGERLARGRKHYADKEKKAFRKQVEAQYEADKERREEAKALERFRRDGAYQAANVFKRALMKTAKDFGGVIKQKPTDEHWLPSDVKKGQTNVKPVKKLRPSRLPSPGSAFAPGDLRDVGGSRGDFVPLPTPGGRTPSPRVRLPSPGGLRSSSPTLGEIDRGQPTESMADQLARSIDKRASELGGRQQRKLLAVPHNPAWSSSRVVPFGGTSHSRSKHGRDEEETLLGGVAKKRKPLPIDDSIEDADFRDQSWDAHDVGIPLTRQPSSYGPFSSFEDEDRYPERDGADEAQRIYEMDTDRFRSDPTGLDAEADAEVADIHNGIDDPDI